MRRRLRRKTSTFEWVSGEKLMQKYGGRYRRSAQTRPDQVTGSSSASMIEYMVRKEEPISDSASMSEFDSEGSDSE